MNTNHNSETAKRILKWALLAITAFLLFIPLLAFAAIFFPFPLGGLLEFLISRYFNAINPLTMKIVSATAMDVWIARALAFSLYALAPYFLSKWLVRLLRPIPILNEKGRVLIFITFWTICVAMSFLSKGVYFSQDGKPQKKYYKNAAGIVEFFPSEMNTHPIYGEQLQFVTPQIMKEIEFQKLGYHALTVESSPTDADVYLNWKHLGKTPLRIPQQKTEGLLVVTLRGYLPEFKEISVDNNEPISFNFQPEVIKDSKKFIIIVKQNLPPENISEFLRSALIQQNISVAGIQEGQEFRQQLETMTSIKNEAFLSWARAKFGIDYIIFANAKHSITELGKIDVGYENIQKSIQGMLRNQVTLELQIFDLKTGDNTETFTSKAEETTDKETSDLSGLLQQVCSQSARKIKKENL